MTGLAPNTNQGFEKGNLTAKNLAPLNKILLLNPFKYDSINRNITVDSSVSRHAGQEVKTGVYYPLGLAYMAATLRKSGFEATLIDPMAEEIPTSRIHEETETADVIILPFSPDHQDDTARYFGEFSGKLRILCGGIAPHIAESIFAKNLADIILVGEPEETIVEVVQNYPDISNIKGIIYPGENGAIVRTVGRPPVEDLDSLPFPIRDFTSRDKYWDICFFGQPTAWILPARGCPYSCIFCAQYAVNNKRVRRRSAKNIVDEVEFIVNECGITNISFFDETFNMDQKYVHDLCDEIQRRKLKIQWVCLARPDLIEEDTARHMKEAGCVEMRLGLESANDEILTYLEKNITVEKMKAGFDIANKVKLRFSIHVIFGAKMETYETVRKTMDFIFKIKPFYVSFNVLTPLPGSFLFEQMKDQMNLENGLSNLDILHTDVPLGDFSSDELAAIVKKAYREYYVSWYFFQRMLKEFFANPSLGWWIAKTAVTQAGYLYKSLVKRN